VINIIHQAIQTYADALFRLILRIVGDSEEARDLTQDVFVKVLCDPSRLREPQKVKSYLFTTAYHLALNSQRNTMRRRQKLLDLQPPSAIESAEMAILVDDAMKKLSGKQRQVLTLRFYGDMTLGEIADAMNISVGSVKVHIARGLIHLKSWLQLKTAKEI
jgi:RNA polymerase sigma factor (sigma-70 family)